MMKIISVTGHRGSGKTQLSIDLANDLAAKGFEVRVVFEGPASYARSMTSLLHYGARGIADTGICLNIKCDYLIYDGYFHPASSEHHNLSPYISEETYVRLANS